jgi:hypothetical protein
MTEEQKYIDLVDKMLLDERYEFANDFLESMRDYAKKYNILSDGQIKAIKNIYLSIIIRKL